MELMEMSLSSDVFPTRATAKQILSHVNVSELQDEKGFLSWWGGDGFEVPIPSDGFPSGGESESSCTR